MTLFKTYKDDKGNTLKNGNILLNISTGLFYLYKNNELVISIEILPKETTLKELKDNGYIKKWIY